MILHDTIVIAGFAEWLKLDRVVIVDVVILYVG